MNPISLAYVLLLSTAARATADVLRPNYDDAEQKLKFFEVESSDPLILKCDVTAPRSHTVKWKKNGTDIASVPSLKGRYEILDAGNSLKIPDPGYSDDGIYTCSVPELDASAIIRVVANVFIKPFPNRIFVDEGDKLKIHCQAFGTDPNISWKIGGSYDFNRTHVDLKKDAENIANAILTIKHTEFTDSNTYKCIAVNEATGFNDSYKPAQRTTFIEVQGNINQTAAYFTEQLRLDSQERTFVMIKPFGVHRGLVGEIFKRIEAKGFKLVALKMNWPPAEIWGRLYSNLTKRPFYPFMLKYLSAGPVVASVWEGYNVTKVIEQMKGNFHDTGPGTIRFDFSISNQEPNIIHCSSDAVSAKREMGLWFDESELVSWTTALEDWIFK